MLLVLLLLFGTWKVLDVYFLKKLTSEHADAWTVEFCIANLLLPSALEPRAAHIGYGSEHRTLRADRLCGR